MFRYILKGNACMAIPINSEMGLTEIQEYIRNNSKKIHPSSYDTVFYLGTIEFVNPEIMMVDDFMNTLPHIL